VRARHWPELLRPQVSTKVELEQLDGVRASDAGSIGVRKLGLVNRVGIVGRGVAVKGSAMWAGPDR